MVMNINIHPRYTLLPWHLDIVALIVEHIDHKRDLYNCALVNRAFHCAVTPRLYRVLNAQVRVIRNAGASRIIHPSSTLLQCPRYANFVRHISETATAGDIASALLPSSLASFRLCTSLSSFSWTGGGFLSTDDSSLLAYLDIILAHNFPLRELVIRASPRLSLPVWNKLKKLTNLKSLGFWCLEAEHEALVEWLRGLGGTLERLELVISPLSDRYMQYLSYLPRLRSLCLKAATRCSVPDILTLLPTLTSLEVEYYGFSPIARRSPSSSSSSSPITPSFPSFPSFPISPSLPPSPIPTTSPANQRMASLQHLTITTSAISISSSYGHTEMWAWISQLIPHPQTLQTFTLRASSVSTNMNGNENTHVVEMPVEFLEGLGRVHGESVRVVDVEGVVLPLGGGGVPRGRQVFPRLERLTCALGCDANMSTIESILTQSPSLRELKLKHHSLTLNLETVRKWMTRPRSRLRVIELGGARFTGEWRMSEKTGERCFELKSDSNKSCLTWI